MPHILSEYNGQIAWKGNSLGWFSYLSNLFVLINERTASLHLVNLVNRNYINLALGIYNNQLSHHFPKTHFVKKKRLEYPHGIREGNFQQPSLKHKIPENSRTCKLPRICDAEISYSMVESGLYPWAWQSAICPS